MDYVEPLPGEHTTPVLVFEVPDGERLVTRSNPNGELNVFVHLLPGVAIFTLPTGVERELTSNELRMATRPLRVYAKHRGDFATPIVSFDGEPIDLGQRVELSTPDPIAAHLFKWGNRSCVLLVTKGVDPVLTVTTGQVYTYDREWAAAEQDRPRGFFGRLFGRS